MVKLEQKLEYENRLESLDPDALKNEALAVIWRSRYTANDPASAYYWQNEAIYFECGRRGCLDLYEIVWYSLKRLQEFGL